MSHLGIVINVFQQTKKMVVLVGGKEELRLIPLDERGDVVGVVGFLHMANSRFFVWEGQRAGRANVLVQFSSIEIDQLRKRRKKIGLFLTRFNKM